MVFTKDDLKTGMICLHRNDEYSMVVKDTYEREDNVVFAKNNRTGLDSFDNITFKWDIRFGKKEIQSEYAKTIDIVKIYKPYNVCEGFIIFSDVSEYELQKEVNSWKVLWEEETVEEMTMEQVCRALGKNIKIIK